MHRILLAAVAVFITSPAVATIAIPGSAADPIPDFFGSIPAATFGGSGIPNNAMMVSTSTIGSDTITIGIAATPRFVGSVANDGMGTYTAPAGVGTGSPPGSTWNFSFYADIAGGGSLADYRIELAYDTDPAAGTDISDHGVWDFNQQAVVTGGFPVLPAISTVESSQNLNFDFLNGTPPLSFITPPATTFDFETSGEYTFELRVIAPLVGNMLVDKVSMSVQAIPEPTSVLFGTLLATGFGLAVGRRQQDEEE